MPPSGNRHGGTTDDRTDAVRTMMVDLSAAATVSIGDRFGFFTVIDGRTA
jgi:hypothetical protein